MFGFRLDNFGWSRLLDMVIQPLFTENIVYKMDQMSVSNSVLRFTLTVSGSESESDI